MRLPDPIQDLAMAVAPDMDRPEHHHSAYF